jgi:hypothetical protein
MDLTGDNDVSAGVAGGVVGSYGRIDAANDDPRFLAHQPSQPRDEVAGAFPPVGHHRGDVDFVRRVLGEALGLHPALERIPSFAKVIFVEFESLAALFNTIWPCFGGWAGLLGVRFIAMDAVLGNDTLAIGVARIAGEGRSLHEIIKINVLVAVLPQQRGDPHQAVGLRPLSPILRVIHRRIDEQRGFAPRINGQFF